MAPAFNPIDYSSELEAAGVAKAQAAVHARALGTVLADVAFTHDLVRLEGNLRKEIQHSEEKLTARIQHSDEKLTARIDAVRTDLSAKIDIVDTRLNAKIDSVRHDLGGHVDRLSAEIQTIRLEMGFHRWALGALLAISTMTLALVIKPLLG